MWIDEKYMPLAQAEETVSGTGEFKAQTYEAYADALASLTQTYSEFIMEFDSSGNMLDEYASARLMIRSEDALPDLSAYRVEQRISDTEGHTVLQFASSADARSCAEYLRGYIPT